LLQSKLEPDTSVTYLGKEELLFGNINSITLSNYNEWLTLYIDNELQPEQRSMVEQFAKQHPAVAKDLYILQQTKLPVEAIVFPDKESLYRREEKTRRIGWWKIAAAAAILLGIVGTVVIATNKNKKVDTGIAGTGDSKKTVPVNNKNNDNNNTVDPKATQPDQQLPNEVLPQEVVENKNNTTADQSNNNYAAINNQSPKRINSKQQEKKEVNEVKNDQLIAHQPKEPLKQDDPSTTQDNDVINKRVNKTYDTYANVAAKPLTEDKETRIDPSVTFASTTALDQQTMPVADVVIDQPDEKRNGLRGFLRKVTRTFEKNTNIKATDDDDRLLVGGLAIKL
jgi:hypothetical protein